MELISSYRAAAVAAKERRGLPDDLAREEGQAWREFVRLGLEWQRVQVEDPDGSSYWDIEAAYERARRTLHALNKQIIGRYWVRRRCQSCFCYSDTYRCRLCGFDSIGGTP